MSIPPAFASSIAASIDTPLAQRNENVSSAAALFGQAVLAGHRRPWIEFRRGPLAIQDRLRQHRQALNRLLVAAIVLLSVSTAVTLIRAGRYSRLEASLNDQMTQAFRGAFPGWPIPANLKAVVESEHRKAQTATGESLPAEGQGSAIQTLHDVLTRLPADGRSTLQSMSFEPDAFQIEGRLQSYDQINALVSAARDAGLDVPTPLTRRGSDGFWEFTLKGTRPAAGSNSASVAFKGNGG